MEVAETKSDAKMDLVAITGRMMPAGKPSFELIPQYPTVKALISTHGRRTMLKVIYLLVKDLCSSLNVVRNMNDDQMIEAAAMLIDECDNFRLEDYAMMFALGKRGQLVKIMDRVDLDMITRMMDAYYEMRSIAGKKLQEQEYLKAEAEFGKITAPLTQEEKERQDIFFDILAKFKMDLQKEVAQEKELPDANRAERQKANDERAKKYAAILGVDCDKIKEAFLL